MRDLMIDIETLGNRPGSIIPSIGALVFNAETGEVGEEFYAAIDSETAAAAGLTSDVSTMIWWFKQSKEASDAAFSGDRPIEMALADFADFVCRHEPSRVWAKPPSFDLVMIEAAFRACDIIIPWHFSTHRDCRTIFDLTNTKPEVTGTAHNALDDAKAQASSVIEAYRKLREMRTQNQGPVAWRWRSALFTEWNLTEKPPIDQISMERETELNMQGLEWEELYAGPRTLGPMEGENG